MANILIVYGAKSYPLRATTQDHLYCFRRYTNHHCYYFNMLTLGKPWYRKPPRFIQETKFDLVIFYLDLLNIQWPPYSFEKFLAQAEYFKTINATKIALAQDEFYHTDSLNRFICEFDVNHVFSLAHASEWHKIYPLVDFEKVKFHRILPGYLDESRLRKIKREARVQNDRPITIGYRAVKDQNMHWLGRHGFMKLEIADLFKSYARKFNIATDISIRAEDVLLGNMWYRFLLKSKYTIAIEGGASILDHDGSVREKTEAYLAEHPQADFDEVEQASFPGRDGELEYKAISPKHLESCATYTCQILVEGDYNNILKPGVHYIELKRDFSNIEQVLNDIRTDHLRVKIIERAYQDIVESEAYTYRAFVQRVIDLAMPEGLTMNSSNFMNSLRYAQCRVYETSQWLTLIILSAWLRIIRRFLPQRFEALLRKIFT